MKSGWISGLFALSSDVAGGSEVCSEFGIAMTNLLRAHGGCLGVKRMKGVEVCEKPGGVDKQVMIPGFPTAAS